ncbi:C4-dicarboxylate ABC transporter [Paenibacillus chitinolyticus]|uniref:C4-dicarboxylate ABC transporter n=1 Tax=Paenibacillus chitinolyticus TaxID=79263 RepID=A0A410WZ02_9BACL|nr:C4-dicarboxylate transporter DcuC [Paenibacillus chitinolyticus]MCY9590352.1 C4-dicarboxylate transporter DcuC [Paenibacillus chitinolyticus]MCY9596654.1 C4-dicarboxylate transporter DcuC [Paenibacillus chitinolyticus]QAV19658.1 C4-dicarboxylate ABC transporter [Paenibacillus chitinolyticus]
MAELIFGLIVVVLAGWMISKKVNATVVLFVAGIVLLYGAVFMGHNVLPAEAATGSRWFDPMKSITNNFISNLGNIGMTIMVLFGFSSYMTKIGANEVTVQTLMKPLAGIKSVYVLVPVIFVVGNLLSLVVPSASSLAILLMATLYPVLKRIGMSGLTAGAVIATTATIIPTPLGADNVIAAQTLGIDLMEYVMKYHAVISIPTLILMTFAHYFWQKYMDKKNPETDTIDESKLGTLRTDLPPTYYGFLPILPLVLITVFGIFVKSIKIGLVEITFISLIVAVLVEMIRKRKIQQVFEELMVFFRGMGDGLAMVVSLLVAASLLVDGLKALGIVDMLTDSVKDLNGAGMILMFAFSGITALIGLISGGGLAVFYASVGLLPAIAQNVGIDGAMLSIPMQLIANLVRSVSPVAACIIVVCSIIQKSPMEVIKRTSVPIIVGIISTLVLSYVMFS